jgi:deoxycytidylate deaminase
MLLHDLNSMRCAKQITVAIIENKGEYWIGTNWCKQPQKDCPRINMPTGVGYDKCKEICQQTGHAEENALVEAGDNSRGATLYLLGHTLICDNCRKLTEEAGIKDIIIVNNWFKTKKGS